MNTASFRRQLTKRLDTKLTNKGNPQNNRRPVHERSKTSSISPISGVPPPNDLRGEGDRSEVPQDKELKDIKRTTQALERELLSKISEYKACNKTHLEKRSLVFSQVEDCHGELEVIKDSLVDILKEAKYTKEELREMREKIDEEAFRDLEQSTYRVNQDPIFTQLMELKKEVDFMNNKLNYTENELRLKSDENSQLRDVVHKLRESIIEENIIEAKTVDANCKVCIIM
jgi:hypothetical protein